MLLNFLIALSLCVFSNGNKLLSFIEPCKVDDQACILSSAKKAYPHLVPGIPELGIPSVDPLILDDINADNGPLKLRFKDFQVYGVGKCTILKIERSTKYNAELIVECPITAKGQYDLEGKLFVIDVFGKGDCEIKTDKFKIEVKIEIKEIKGEDGKDYYKIKRFDYKYLPEEKMHFTFNNLYNGDKEKAEPVVKILNESWLEVLNGFGKSVIKELITKAVNCVDQLFQNLPIEEFEKA